jgi:hypothetical protein
MAVLHVNERVLHHARHLGINSQRRAVPHEARPSSDRGIESLRSAVVYG